MNLYYNFTLNAVPGEVIESRFYNTEMTKISEGFDKLPTVTSIVDGTLVYGKNRGSHCHNNTVASGSFVVGSYIQGELTASNMIIGNNSGVTFSLNGRGNRPVVFEIFGGAVAEDLRGTGIYTVVYDNDRFYCLEMSPRGFISSQRHKYYVDTNAPIVAAQVFGGSVVGSVDFFPVGTQPTTQYPGTTWERSSATVSSVTDGMISSTDLVTWIRRT
jgi:hypothetical protein